MPGYVGLESYFSKWVAANTVRQIQFGKYNLENTVWKIHLEKSKSEIKLKFCPCLAMLALNHILLSEFPQIQENTAKKIQFGKYSLENTLWKIEIWN